MKKIKILKDGQIFRTNELEESDSWGSKGVANNWWGLPERWVLHKDEPESVPYDGADVLEEKTEQDNSGVDVKMVKLKAEYTIEIEDITAQVEQEKVNAEALAYLASTDWMVIREMDQGTACPAEVKQARAEARARIVK